MAGGRPLKFQTVQALEDEAKVYFEKTPFDLWTITGLAIHLDTSRETLMDYQERPEFSDTIKALKLKIENSYEIRGIKRGNAFDIFALKNFGWKDKQELDHTTAGKEIGLVSPVQAKSILDAIDPNPSTN